MIRQAEIFAPANQEDEVRQWQDWRLSFCSWLFFAQEDFKKDLDKAERSDKPLGFIDLSLEEHERSEKLFSILTGVLRNRHLKILRSVEDGNGIDAWRALSQQVAPRTRSRSISLLQAYSSHPVFTKDKSILEQVLGLGRLAEEYKTVSGNALADDTQLSTLLRVVPAQLRNHLQLSMEEDADYGKIREKVVSYERTTSSWSSQANYREFDIKKDDGHDEAVPMEVDRVKGIFKGKQKGKSKWSGKDYNKGKGKWKDGKPKLKDKGKGKEYNKGDAGRGKGKCYLSPDTCKLCGQKGHWSKECPVRSVEPAR